MKQIKQCDPKVRRKCPDAGFCKGVFMEGSECDSLQSKLAEQVARREARLIYLDHALQAVSSEYLSNMPEHDLALLLTVRKKLKALPTLDVSEVVHGRWEDVVETEMYVPDMKYTVTHTAETCSACNVRIGFIGSKLYLYDNICPNCGAKMDLEE